MQKKNLPRKRIILGRQRRTEGLVEDDDRREESPHKLHKTPLKGFTAESDPIGGLEPTLVSFPFDESTCFEAQVEQLRKLLAGAQIWTDKNLFHFYLLTTILY
ncbi:hypothetical protein, partial [Meiothermus luteus]|uniref:hypothetical protein n=1 Tax=Meiothermus luteus TaxID=2026184 RepID=UPI001C712579